MAHSKKSVIRERTSNVSDLANFAGVSRNTIYQWQRLPGFPKAGDGSVCKWELCEWVIRRSMTSDPTGEHNEMEPGASSPALERFRAARADMEEIKLQKERKELVSRENMHLFVIRVASLFRGWLDRLQRQHGEDVYQTGVDLLGDIEAETAREFGPDGEPIASDQKR